MRAIKITKNITRRDQASLEKYFTEIARHDLLTPDEEVEIFRRFQNGEDVLEEIVLKNLRFVVSVAKQYQRLGLPLGDLISEGNVGLIKAANRFDPSRGFKFISYAVWWIRQSIIQAVNDKSRNIRLPINIKTDTNKVLKAYSYILQREERKPRVDELAAVSGVGEQSVERCLRHYQRIVSLDSPVAADSDTSRYQLMEDESTNAPDHSLQYDESQSIQVQKMLGALSFRQSTVLSLSFGIDQNHPMNLSDIAEKIGVTRERVRQIRNRGILKLRNRFSQEIPIFSPS